MLGSVLHSWMIKHRHKNCPSSRSLMTLSPNLTFVFCVQFVKVYALKSSTRILSELRWELFRAKNLESEMLPPTVGTLIPHAQRVNYIMVMRDRGYISPHPSVQNLEGNGWSERGLPIKCIVCPAPHYVVVLVKCGCKGECKGNCSCTKNGLACTALCKCHAAGCSNHNVYHGDGQDEDSERKRGTLTDSRSSAKSLVNQYMQVLINIFIFVDSCDSKCFMLYLN